MEKKVETITKPKRKVQYNLRTEPEILQWLKEQSAKHDRPINYIINHAIKQFKQQQEI